MKVTIDEDACTSCGLCEDTCPDVFELGDEIAEVKVDVVPEELEDDCKQAAEECPTEAIII
nr:ferredoxin [bacterium]